MNKDMDLLKEKLGELEGTTIEIPLRTIDLFCDEYYRNNAAKDIDLVMLTYIIAGLSLQSVALICGIKDTNVYNRWYRLKGKLQKRYPERKEELERILNRTPTGRAKPAR